MSFQKPSIRSDQNKIFKKNRVFVEILQFSKKYEFNKAKSIDHSVVLRISISRLFIDENFSLNSFGFLNLFYQTLLKNTLIHEVLAEARSLKKENTVTILNRVRKKLDKMTKFRSVSLITHCCYPAR